MVLKAKKRKKDTGKDTIFVYGGLRYDKQRAANTAGRSKKANLDSEAMGMPNTIRRGALY
jgi:hypothetical protein